MQVLFVFCDDLNGGYQYKIYICELGNGCFGVIGLVDRMYSFVVIRVVEIIMI